jgi:hypothetical protein
MSSGREREHISRAAQRRSLRLSATLLAESDGPLSTICLESPSRYLVEAISVEYESD